MSEWAMKRFWTSADVAEADGGFAVVLDGRPVKTPAKQGLILPTKALAQAVAEEWDAQEEKVDPEAMPLTRLSNSAVDKVAKQHGDVAAMLAEYGGSDLLCYRAERPDELIRRQSAAWDSMLGWARDTHGIELVTQGGVMPVAQPDASLAKMSELTHALDPFELTAFHELVTLSGSWILGYAALTELEAPDSLWNRTIVDELWQEEQWGADEEALESRDVKRAAFLIGHRYNVLCRAA
jgi:chaperone required for assembly of F1-ATPase